MVRIDDVVAMRAANEISSIWHKHYFWRTGRDEPVPANHDEVLGPEAAYAFIKRIQDALNAQSNTKASEEAGQYEVAKRTLASLKKAAEKNDMLDSAIEDWTDDLSDFFGDAYDRLETCERIRKKKAALEPITALEPSLRIGVMLLHQFDEFQFKVSTGEESHFTKCLSALAPLFNVNFTPPSLARRICNKIEKYRSLKL